MAALTAAEWKNRLRCAPLAALRDVVAPGGVLVLAPHPDDESLGCGGLIAQCAAEGLAVGVAVLTDGAASHPDSVLFPPARLTALREEETRLSLNVLGLGPANARFLGHPDGHLSMTDLGETLASLADWVLDAGFRTLLVTAAADPHPDHRAAHALALRLTRRLRRLGRELSLYAYPIWAWTLPPDAHVPMTDADRPVRLDIRAEIHLKRRAVFAHQTQVSALISDDPLGFRLSPEHLSLFVREHETFIKEGG